MAEDKERSSPSFLSFLFKNIFNILLLCLVFLSHCFLKTLWFMSKRETLVNFRLLSHVCVCVCVREIQVQHCSFITFAFQKNSINHVQKSHKSRFKSDYNRKKRPFKRFGFLVCKALCDDQRVRVRVRDQMIIIKAKPKWNYHPHLDLLCMTLGQHQHHIEGCMNKYEVNR